MLNQRITALALAGTLVLTVCGAAVFADEPEQNEDAAQQVETIGVNPQGEDNPAQADPSAVDSQQPTADSQQPAGEPEQHAAPEVKNAEPVTGGAEKQAVTYSGTTETLSAVSFDQLASRMRAKNLNMLALEETISSLKALDYDKLTDEIRTQLDEVVTAQKQITDMIDGVLDMLEQLDKMMPGRDVAETGKLILTFATANTTQSLEQANKALKDTLDDLESGKMQADNDAIIFQLRNAQNQIIMAGESIYTALVNLELNQGALNRSEAALKRTVQEMELRYQMGQISSLTLQQIKSGQTSLASGKQTLAMNVGNLKAQLELLLGAKPVGKITLQPVTRVTAQQVSAMNQTKDMEQAKKASYTLFAAKRTLEEANEKFNEAKEQYSTGDYQYAMAQHTWQGAQYTYAASVQNFEAGFRALYNQVKDANQILNAKQTALQVEKSSFAAAQLKYKQGTISKNALLKAQDDLSTAQDGVDTAALDLFTAYHNYRWAVEHGILN